MFNIVSLIVLTLNMTTVLSSPPLYIVFFGFFVYTRINDALVQVLILKPASEELFPSLVSAVGNMMLATTMSSKRQLSKSLTAKILTTSNSRIAPTPVPPPKVAVAAAAESEGWQTAIDDY